jgi:hypothetical protein
MTMRCGRAVPARLRVVAVTALCAAAALSGCASASKTQGQGTLNTVPTSPAATATSGTTTAPATTPATQPSTPATPPSTPAGQPTGKQYALARTQWQQGATAISADQGKYWLTAAADLTAGEVTDGGNTSGYLAAITALGELAALPDAQQTPAQNAAFHADIAALNTFFNTPGLYS